MSPPSRRVVQVSIGMWRCEIRTCWPAALSSTPRLRAALALLGERDQPAVVAMVVVSAWSTSGAHSGLAKLSRCWVARCARFANNGFMLPAERNKQACERCRPRPLKMKTNRVRKRRDRESLPQWPPASWRVKYDATTKTSAKVLSHVLVDKIGCSALKEEDQLLPRCRRGQSVSMRNPRCNGSFLVAFRHGACWLLHLPFSLNNRRPCRRRVTARVPSPRPWRQWRR
jgi:hypothetical protein